MDKQEYREIVGDIRRAYDRGEFDKVLMYADELELRRVSDSRVLEMIADAYNDEGDLQTARELLQRAYEKTPMGRKMAYKLSELSIELGDLDGAVEFYEDFCKMAPNDNDRFLLKYKIGKAGRVAKKDLAKVLAAYCAREVDEKWMAELAAIYDEIGEKEKCNEVCDDIILWFADGAYVQKALEMKGRNGQLTPSQEEKLHAIREQAEAEAAAAAARKEQAEDRQLRPGSIEPEELSDDDLDSILEEFITIEDATTPPEPVSAEDMEEAARAKAQPVVEENDTEVIPVEQIREAAASPEEEQEEISEAKKEARKAAVIEEAIRNMPEEEEEKPAEEHSEEEMLTDVLFEELELETAPVHAEVREKIAENMDQPEQEEIPDVLSGSISYAKIEESTPEVVYPEEPQPEYQEDAALEEAPEEEAPEPAAQEPLFVANMPGGRPFSNIEAMQSARTAPPKDDASFWKMPDELTMEEEAAEEEFPEPVYGSHRWFEEKTEPEFEEPVFGAHRYIPEPVIEEYDEHYDEEVEIQQVEPEPITIEPADEDAGAADHIPTIRTTSSGAELLGMYAATKQAGTDENLSEQAALVKKPALSGKKIPAPELFADPITEPEYYEGPEYIEEAEAGYTLAEEEVKEKTATDLVNELFAEDVEEEAALPAGVVFLQDEGTEEAPLDPYALKEEAVQIFEETQAEEPGASDFERAVFDFEREHQQEAAPQDDHYMGFSADAVIAGAAAQTFSAEEPVVPEAIVEEAVVVEEAPKPEEPVFTEEPAAEPVVPEEPQPSPFLFTVQPHEAIQEVVPDVVRERLEAEKAAEEAAKAAAEAEKAAAEEIPAFEDMLAEFDKDILEEVIAEEEAPQEEPFEEPFEEEIPEETEDPYALKDEAVQMFEDSLFDGHAPTEFDEAVADFEQEHLQDAEEAYEDLYMEGPSEEEEPLSPEAEPSVFIPLEQLSEAEQIEAEMPEEIPEEEIAEEVIPEPALDIAEEDGFAGAVQEFELSSQDAAAEFEETFEPAAPEVEEAPIIEITAPIPAVEDEEAEAEAFEPAAELFGETEAFIEEAPEAEVPLAEEPQMEGFIEEAIDEVPEEIFEDIPEEVFDEFPEEVPAEIPAEEEQPELSDFEKAMLAFDQAGADAEDDFDLSELVPSFEEEAEAEGEVWEEPEFGLPDFDGSEFEKPAFLGNDFDEPEIPEAAEEAPSRSDFEKAMLAFDRDSIAEEAAVEEAAFEEAAPAAEEPAQTGYQIQDELRDELREFLMIDGMEERISNAIGNLIENKRAGDPTGGHMIVTGDAKSGKTYLTISVIKAVGKETGSTAGRVAKVKAEALNGKDMTKVFGKIKGSDLIIENAGYLNDTTIENLIDAVKTSAGTSMIVLEGNRLGIENLITKHPELNEVFRTRLDLSELSLSEWADQACAYAQERGYKVGDMALLALHAKIDELNLPTTRLVVEDVQGVIDRAIEKAERRASGRFPFGGRKGRDGERELDETDFM